MNKILLFLGCVFMLCSFCSAQTTKRTLDDGFFDQTIQPDPMTDAMQRARLVRGENAVIRELNRMAEGPSAWEKVKGVVTFANIIGVTAAFLLIVALGWLTRLYLLNFILWMGPALHQAFIYLISVVLILMGTQVSPQYQNFVILPGCLGIAGGLLYTLTYYFPKGDAYWVPSLILAVVWGIVAICYGSQVIGFISVLALFAALGFSAMLWPGVIAVGFEDDDAVARGTFTALIFTIIHVLSYVLPFPHWYSALSTGFAFVGVFVYFLGLLIVSSKHYLKGRQNYLFMQVATIISGVAALYFGSTLGITLLLGIGGTFFYIYLLEKYYEIPWEGAGWAWSLLGLSGMLYAFAVYAKGHPQFFIW